MLNFQQRVAPSGAAYQVAEMPGPTKDGWPKRLQLEYGGMNLRLAVAQNGMCVMGGDQGEFSMGCVAAIAHALVQLGVQYRIEEMRFLWLVPRMESLIQRIAQRAVEIEPRISLDLSKANTIIARRTDWGDQVYGA